MKFSSKFKLGQNVWVVFLWENVTLVRYVRVKDILVNTSNRYFYQLEDNLDTPINYYKISERFIFSSLDQAKAHVREMIHDTLKYLEELETPDLD